jgi:2-iminobutanoate/2-iminopropanoate deaminase
MYEVKTERAPEAIGPYAQARRAGDLIFVSGQLPIDPATGIFNSEDAAQQARQSLKNIKAIAEAAGTDIASTVKTTIFLTDLSTFAAVNEVYAGFFEAPYPARACVEVSALPKGAKVEIEAVIAFDGK